MIFTDDTVEYICTEKVGIAKVILKFNKNIETMEK